MPKAFGRIIAFLALFLLFAFALEVATANWFGHAPAAGPKDPALIQLAQADAQRQFIGTYGPMLYAFFAFVSGLAAFRPRPLTIVSAGLGAVLVFFIAPAVIEHRPGPPADTVVAGPTPDPAPTARSQQKAVKAFPELGLVGSKLNEEFNRRYRQYQKEKPAFFNDPEWPATLAQEAHDAVYYTIDPRFLGKWEGKIDPDTGEMPGAAVTYTLFPEKKLIYVEVWSARLGSTVTIQVGLDMNPVSGNVISGGGFQLAVEPNARSGHFRATEISTGPGVKRVRVLGEGTLKRMKDEG